MTSSEIHNLPDDFQVSTDDILIYFYANNKSSVKNKVVFTKNMFCLLQHGVKEVQTPAGKETVLNHEMLMLTSGSVLMSETLADNGKYEAILIFFGNKTLFDFCARQGLTAHKKTNQKTVIKLVRDEFLNHYCDSLKLLHQEHHIQMDELKVQEILAYIQSKYPEKFRQFISQAFTDTADIKLKQVVDLHANKGLSITELAFLSHMSVSTFKRHFSDIYHMPPHKYIMQIKMEQAKALLSMHKRPSDIYSELGYENLPAFSTEFKKQFGLSPKQFQDGLIKKAIELEA